ncbi:unnamed protein product [Paramecium sonneborni]|uniref:non-specific serine/threonine protein kinase n=1 Tax=Paramecium sonneborni TaxID=65129 RepID=A0A8S1RB80_9CILI|nr:unnamed protein product [Paramecium sonneborni]
MDLAAMTPQEKDETLREAKIIEFLSHPNIVKFREVYKTKKGRLCIVMEYADGGDLSQKIKEAKGKCLSENQILDWFTQICLAIKHVHDRKIIHRDLKGQNIFLTKEGQVKLGDFGIARILKKTVEKAKTMVGTPYYISPEIIEGKPYTFMTDIWSLGVILYELCALQPPFNAESLHFLALNIVKGQYKPIPAHYSKELKQLVQCLLQVDQRRRPTIQEILKMPVITNRIKSFLTETIQRAEFSHTIFHNKVFEVKGNLNQVNLIINEQPCPPQLLEQNAKNLQEFPDIVKKPSLQEFDPIRPPQLSKQQQPPSSRYNDPKDQPKINQQEKQQDIPKQSEIPKKIDPITKNSPLIQKKEPSKETPPQKEIKKQSPLQQKNPSRPKSDQEKQQKSEPCRFDAQVQKKHSNSEQALIPEQKKQQFISPKHQQKIDQPRPPTAPKDKPQPQLIQQRPQSSKPQVQDQKVVVAQKVNIEKKRPISVDKAPIVQPQQQKQQQLEYQRQEERIRLLKQRQQEQQEKERREREKEKERELKIQQEQLLEKQRQQQQIEKQQQLERQRQQQQLEKQTEQERQRQEEKQRQNQSQQNQHIEINKNEQQKQQLERQPSQRSSQMDNKQNESKQQMKSKADQLQKIEKNGKDFDLMLKELEGLLNNVNNAIDKFPNQGGKENYFDYNTIQTMLIEDREDDEDEPTDNIDKKSKQIIKQISKEEEECFQMLNEKSSTLKIKLENALGVEKMNRAKNILKQTLEQMDLDRLEKQYGPNYDKLLPFLTLEERKKYAPLLFTYIITG